MAKKRERDENRKEERRAGRGQGGVGAAGRGGARAAAGARGGGRDVERKAESNEGGNGGGDGGSHDGAQVSQEEFLAGLNEDLSHEYAAVITYRTYASQVQGQWRMELRNFFEAEIPDELGHAQILADKIVALGGTPTVLAAPVKQAVEPRQMLENALEDEIETIDRYVRRRDQAESLGHFGLAVDLDDLIRDETSHRDEISMILKRWDRA
jgi:bacterioferritin